jgi:hypothetical protein
MLRGAAEQFQTWVNEQADGWGSPIIEAPKGRRDEFAEPYFKCAALKAREPARIMTAIGDRKTNRWHLQIAERWVVQYNFYVNDRTLGPDVRADVPLSVVLRPGLSQSTSLARQPHARGGHRFGGDWGLTSGAYRAAGFFALKSALTIILPTRSGATTWRLSRKP